MSLIEGGLQTGAYIGGSVHDNRNGIGNASAHLTAFSTIRFSDAVNMRVEVEKSYNIDAEQHHEYSYLVESRFRLTRNSAIRLSYRKRGVEEFSVAFDRYF